MSRFAWALVLLELGCRRVPLADTAPPLEVRIVSLSFPRPEEGELSFEVELPRALPRIGALRWELFLGGRRFAEGAAMNPEVKVDGSRRVLRVEAPLVFRRLGWREGGSFLDVGLAGELQPPEGEQRWAFKGRTELLVNAAPIIDEPSE